MGTRRVSMPARVSVGWRWLRMAARPRRRASRSPWYRPSPGSPRCGRGAGFSGHVIDNELRRSRMRRIALLVLLSSVITCSATTFAGEAAWRATVRQFAAQHFKHPAWGYSHSVRDYELASALAAADHVTLDDDVLFAAAYLHDMAAFAPGT